MNRFLAIAINCFFAIECALGYYSNIFGKWYLNYVSRMYCISICMFYFYGFTLYAHAQNIYYFYIIIGLLVDYLLCSLASFFTGKEDLHSFIRLSLLLETRIGTAKKRKTDFIILYGFIILLMGKLFYLQASLEHVKVRKMVLAEHYKTVCVFWSMYKMGQLLNNLSRSIPFQLTYNGMKSLRLSFETKIIGNRCSVTEKIATINEHAQIYQSLLENLNATGLIFRMMNFRDVTFAMYYVLMITIGITFNDNRAVNLYMVVEASSFIMLFLLPCILLELTKNEVNKLKNTLIETYRNSEDETLRDKIMDVVKFLELRPFEFTVWRLYAIDVRLSLVFLNLMSTYILVALQFTHLFD